ncbi:hypothetical protein [Actinosynnema pretiosum]|uniref:hypothetical protein n=1 Tax=Actinosynnema pretiosum TaxID=42197 RepID=UPI0015A5EB44|nr:hypothetical protein [Actinosynnema pretiosum]
MARSALHRLLARHAPHAPARRGLVDDAEVTARPLLDDVLRTAVEAAEDGSWRPASRLLATTGWNWERRWEAVQALAAHADEADGDWMQDWLLEQPHSPDAITAHTGWLIAHAEVLRRDRAVPVATRLRGFRRALVAAGDRAGDAARLAPDDPTPWAQQLAVVHGLRLPEERFARVWKELLDRDPLHRAGHALALRYRWDSHLTGRAPGARAPEPAPDAALYPADSYPEALDFADQAADSSPSLSWLRLLVAAQAGHWDEPAVAASISATTGWLRDGGGDAPDARHHRAALALALVRTGGHADAVEQFRALGRRADSPVWDHVGPTRRSAFLGTRAEACRNSPRG